MESRSTKVRLVRCPKCLKLLVEYADIPVYQCGGCHAVLRAKNGIAAGKNVDSVSLGTNHHQSVSDDGFSDNGSTSSAKQMIACSTSAHSSELEHQEKETMLSSAEHNHQEDGETSGQNGLEDANQFPVRSDASQSQPDEGIRPKMEVEESLKLLKHHSGSSKVMNKVEEPPDSSSHSFASEEDTVERGSGDRPDISFRSLAARISNGGRSSSDDGYNNSAPERFLLRSRRTFRQPKVLDMADIEGKGGEEVSGSSQTTSDVEADLRARTLRGTEGRQPFHHKSEHQPPQHFNSNLLHRRSDALYRPRQITSQQYQFSQMPFSGGSCCSCLYSRLEDQRLQLQPNHCIDDVCRAHAYSLRSHSSMAGSSRMLDDEQEMLHYNEKRKPKKNHCRPIAGGAPFIICYYCFNLLQLPADFLTLRRRLHKLHCAACSKVLTISFPAKDCISPQTPIKEVHPHTEDTSGTDVVTGSVSHSNDCPLDDPVSFSEAYALSFTTSFSTEADRVLHLSRNSSAGNKAKQTSGSPLHRLMGYSSPSELLHQCWDIDEGYESIESVVAPQESMQSLD